VSSHEQLYSLVHTDSRNARVSFVAPQQDFQAAHIYPLDGFYLRFLLKQFVLYGCHLLSSRSFVFSLINFFSYHHASIL